MPCRMNTRNGHILGRQHRHTMRFTQYLGPRPVKFTDHNRDLQINGQNTAISLLPQDYANIDVPCCAFRNRSYLRFKKKSQPTGNKGVLFFPQTGEIQKLREKSQLIQLRNLPVIRLQYGRHS